MGRWPGILLILVLAAVLPRPAMADEGMTPAENDSLAAAWEDDVASQQGWLSGLLHRYFGRAPQEGDELDGRPEVLVDQYDRHIGKRIDVVIISSVLHFQDPPDTSDSAAGVWLNSLAGRFRSFTGESVVRDYLLFENGDTVDPFSIADSERMLRGLDFINDARILVIPLGPDDETVAVVVEYRDRWPLGISGTIKTVDRYDLGLYTTNLAGRGIRFDNRLIANRAGDPRLGYAGSLSKQNVAGSFVDATIGFEDSWQALSRYGRLDRLNRHYRIRFVGGLRYEDVTARDNGGVPRRSADYDSWLGRVIHVAEGKAYRTGVRRTVTPAVRYSDREFLDRPAGVAADTLTGYHEKRTLLGGLTYQRRVDVKTSYLFRMGEAEDLPHGWTMKLSSGYEDGEFHRRTAAAIQARGIYVAEDGWVASGGFGYSGYWRNGDFEDGVLEVDAVYITPLLGQGRYQHRVYSVLQYMLGIDRVIPDGLRLGNRTGIRDLDDNAIKGDQRLVLKLEWRVFTPWRLLGFRIMTFVFADGGLMGGEHDPILEKKLYTAVGVGMRFNNPDLVLPTFEFRLGALQQIEEPAFGFAFDLGNMNYPEVEVPGEKPGLVPYK